MVKTENSPVFLKCGIISYYGETKLLQKNTLSIVNYYLAVNLRDAFTHCKESCYKFGLAQKTLNLNSQGRILSGLMDYGPDR